MIPSSTYAQVGRGRNLCVCVLESGGAWRGLCVCVCELRTRLDGGCGGALHGCHVVSADPDTPLGNRKPKDRESASLGLVGASHTCGGIWMSVMAAHGFAKLRHSFLP